MYSYFNYLLENECQHFVTPLSQEDSQETDSKGQGYPEPQTKTDSKGAQKPHSSIFKALATPSFHLRIGLVSFALKNNAQAELKARQYINKCKRDYPKDR